MHRAPAAPATPPEGASGESQGITRSRGGAFISRKPETHGPADPQGGPAVDDKRDRVSMDDIEAESAVSLPNKEVLSLLDVNANVDLGLDLAAPVDLAAAANLNVAAPIEAAAAANVLSPDAQAVSLAHQSGSIDQGISGSADATANQHAGIVQDSTGGGRLGRQSRSAGQGTSWSAARAANERRGTVQPSTGGGRPTRGRRWPAVGREGGAPGAAPADAGGAVGGAVEGAPSGASGAVD